MNNSSRLALLAALLVLATALSGPSFVGACNEDITTIEGKEGCDCEDGTVDVQGSSSGAGPPPPPPTESTTESSTSTGSSSTSTGSSSTSTGSSSTEASNTTSSQLENGLQQIKTTYLLISEQVVFEQCISDVRYVLSFKKTIDIKKLIQWLGYTMKKWCKKNKGICKKLKNKKLFGKISFKKFCAVGERYFAKYQFKNLFDVDFEGGTIFTTFIEQNVEVQCGKAVADIYVPISKYLKKRMLKDLVGKGKAKKNEQITWLLKGLKKNALKKLSIAQAQCVLDMVHPACGCTHDQILTQINQVNIYSSIYSILVNGPSGSSKVNVALKGAVANATASGNNSTSNATLKEVSDLSKKIDDFADANPDPGARVIYYSDAYDSCSQEAKDFVSECPVPSPLDNSEEDYCWDDIVRETKAHYSFANLTGQGFDMNTTAGSVTGQETVIKDSKNGSDVVDALNEYKNISQDASVSSTITNCKKCINDAVLPRPGTPAKFFPATSSGRFDCSMWYIFDYMTRALANKQENQQKFKATKIPTKFLEFPDTCEFMTFEIISNPTCSCSDT